MATVDLDDIDEPQFTILSDEQLHELLDVQEDGIEKPKMELSSAEAIELVDSTWYAMVSRKARWMDLIGDYAGNENFVLDGTLRSSAPLLGGR